MGIDNIQYAKPRQQLRRGDWNAVVDHIKSHPFNQVTGGSEQFRRMTLFYSDVTIPSYSIFPLIPNATDTNDTFNAKYKVEKYNQYHTSQYIPGYFGSNGRQQISAGTSFLGWIINREWDTPIHVSDYVTGSVKAGFKHDSWEATVEASGLVLNGKAPMGSGCYYSRILPTEGEIFLLTLQQDIPPAQERCSNKICVTKGKAWVMDRVNNNQYYTYSCDTLIRRYELNEYVYNNTPYWFRRKDHCGRIILYYGFRDVFGTIWLDRTYWKMPRHWCCSESSSSISSSSVSYSSHSESSSSTNSSSSSSQGSSDVSDNRDGSSTSGTGNCVYKLQSVGIRIYQVADDTIGVPAIEATVTGWVTATDIQVGTQLYWSSGDYASWPYSCDKPVLVGGIQSDNVPTASVTSIGNYKCFDEQHYYSPDHEGDTTYYTQELLNLQNQGFVFSVES